jgi:excisionase family DNA binding protein
MTLTLLTPKQVGALLQVSRYRVYELIRLGLLPGTVRVGRQIRIDPSRLDESVRTGGSALPGGWRRETR